MAGTPPASCGRRDGTHVFLEDGPSAPSCGPEPQGQHGLPRHLQLSPPPPSAPPPGYPSETPVPEGRRGVALTHPDPPRTAPGRMAGPLGAQRPHPWKGIGKPTLVRAKRVRKPPDPHGGAEPASVTGPWRPQGHWRWGEPASLRLFRGRAPAPSPLRHVRLHSRAVVFPPRTEIPSPQRAPIRARNAGTELTQT